MNVALLDDDRSMMDRALRSEAATGRKLRKRVGSSFFNILEMERVSCTFPARSASDMQNPGMIINDALMIAAPCGER